MKLVTTIFQQLKLKLFLKLQLLIAFLVRKQQKSRQHQKKHYETSERIKYRPLFTWTISRTHLKQLHQLSITMKLYFILFLFIFLDYQNQIGLLEGIATSFLSQQNLTNFTFSAFPRYQHVYVLFDPILLTVELIYHKISDMIADNLSVRLCNIPYHFEHDSKFLENLSTLAHVALFYIKKEKLFCKQPVDVQFL